MSLRIKYNTGCDCGGTMTSTTLDLSQDPGREVTEFLEARIAEDEAEAEKGGYHNASGVFAGDNYGCLLIQPARVLAECEAKRAIIKLTMAVHEMDVQLDNEWGGGLEGTAHEILRHLASVYSSHPDYRPEWAV